MTFLGVIGTLYYRHRDILAEIGPPTMIIRIAILTLLNLVGIA